MDQPLRTFDNRDVGRRDRGAGGRRLPPHVYFVGSAVFHYLGPAFAVLLFARVDALGVAWLRIASAGLVFALWRRARRGVRGGGPGPRRNVAALALAVAGVYLLTDVHLSAQPAGFTFAAANAVLFAGYVV